MLDPKNYAFHGTPAQRKAALAQMQKAFAQADAIEDKSERSVDDERTQYEEGALRIVAGIAVRDTAATPEQRASGTRTARSRQRRSESLGRCRAIRPRRAQARGEQPDARHFTFARVLSFARLPDMIAQSKRYTELKPNDGDGWSDLGLAYQRTRQFAAAAPAYEHSLELLRDAATKAPTQDNIADVADTSLDLADVYVALGDANHTRSTFDQANTYGDELDPNGRLQEPQAQRAANARKKA